jgi:hypothetical protein
MASPRFAAERVLDELGIVVPEDLQLLDLIAYQRRAVVRYSPLLGAEARMAVLGRNAVITVSTSIQNPQRRRFSVAHELGHLELHRWQHNVFVCTSKDINDTSPQRVSANLEQEANEFAAELLLPERFFAHLCNREAPSLDRIAQLAGAFSVSLTATALRYLRFCSEPCAVVFSQDGYIRWFQRSTEFEDAGLFIEGKCRPEPSTIAAMLFSGRSMQRTQKRVRASAWFSPGRYREDATILEQSWGMPNYNAVITLIWIDEDLEEEDDLW